MSGQAFRGTSADQDSRFGKADDKLIAKLQKEGKFSPSLNVKINMSKVNAAWLEQWVETRVTELLGREDDIVTAMITNLLRPDTRDADRLVWTDKDAKRIQVEVTGFLQSQASQFMGELWLLLASAQSSNTGTPAAPVVQVAVAPKKLTEVKPIIVVKAISVPTTVAAPVQLLSSHHIPGAVVSASAVGVRSRANISDADATATDNANAPLRRKRSRFLDVEEEA